MRLLEVRKRMFSVDILFRGRRVISILRLRRMLDAILTNQLFLVGYRELKQHGIELSAGCAYMWTGHYELVDVAVGDLGRMSAAGSTPIGETALVKYLTSGDEGVLRDYYRGLAGVCAMSESGINGMIEESRKLFGQLDKCEYDPAISCIVVNSGNGIIDGYHRSSLIYAKHGPAHKIKVLRILPVNL